MVLDPPTYATYPLPPFLFPVSPPPFCSCPVFPLRERAQTRPIPLSDFLSPPKLVLEAALYSKFPTPRKSLLSVLSQEMRHINIFLRCQNRVSWVGDKKFMLTKFMCSICPLNQLLIWGRISLPLFTSCDGNDSHNLEWPIQWISINPPFPFPNRKVPRRSNPPQWTVFASKKTRFQANPAPGTER